MSQILFTKFSRSASPADSLIAHVRNPVELTHDPFSGKGFQGVVSHHAVYTQSACFESESGEIGIAIDGWAAIGNQQVPDLLQRCVELYNKKGIEFVQSLNGAFNLFLWDKANEQIHFANDRYGLRPVFHLQHKGSDFLGSSIASMLAASGKQAELNERTLYNLLSFSRVWAGDQTLFLGVRAVQPGTILTWSNNDLTERTYWDYQFEPADELSDNDVDEFVQDFRDAIPRHLPVGSPCGISLSGGLDSRAVLAGFSPERLSNLKAYTWGYAQHCGDVRLAEDTASAFNVDWNFVELSPADFLTHAKEGTRYLDGNDLAVQSYGLKVYPQIAEECKTLVTGLAFDIITSGSYSSLIANSTADKKSASLMMLKKMKYFCSPAEEIFCETKRANEQISEVNRQLQKDLSRYSDQQPADMVDCFLMRQRAWRVLFSRQKWQRMFVEDSIPTFDNNVIDRLLRIPASERANHRFYRRFLSKLDQRCMDIPYQGTMLPPSVPVDYWAEATQVETSRENLLKKIYYETGGEVYIPYDRYYSNFDEWLRVDEVWRSTIQQLLLGSGARLCDYYIRRDWLERLLSQQFSGEAANYSQIIILMSVELALRELF